MKKNTSKPYISKNKTIIEKIVDDKDINRKNILLHLGLVFLVPFLLYLPSLSYDFTHFDDDGLITNNLAFLSDLNNAGELFLRDAFITKISPFYRPLQSLSYMIDIQLSGGNNPWIYHLSNILLLAFIACSIFFILLRFDLRIEFALLSTLIYCAHPLFVSSVAWIPARGDLQLMLFSLLSFLFLIDFFRKQKIIFLLLHWASFTLALFSKETAAFLPIIFLLYLLAFNKEKIFIKYFAINIFLYTISGLFWYWLRSQSIGDFTNRTDVFGLNAVLPNLRTIPESISMFIFPFDIAIIPGFTKFKTISGVVIISLGTFSIFYNTQRTMKEKIFWVAWYLLLIIPTLLFKHVLIDYLNHRFFLPLVGIWMLLLFVSPKRWTERKNKSTAWIMITLFLCLSAITLYNMHAYSNLTTFYSTAIAKNPHSAISYNNRGFDKINNNDFQGAVNDFNKAIEINPNYDMAYNNRGYSRSNLNDTMGAIKDFQTAIRLNSKFAEPYFNIGKLNNNLGNYKEAINNFNRYLEIKPNAHEVYNLRGIAVGTLGNFKEAIEDFNKAISINPNFLEAFGNRSIAKYRENDLKGSLNDCEKVLELNPSNINAINLKSIIQKELGEVR